MQQFNYIKQHSRHWGFPSCARCLVNTPKLVSKVELQSAPEDAKYYSNFLSTGSHNSSPSARGPLSISPYGWEIDGNLISVYWASTYSSCLVSTNHTSSLSCGPPPSSSRQISAALTGSLDRNDMQRCLLLIIPRMYHVIVSPWQRRWWYCFW